MNRSVLVINRKNMERAMGCNSRKSEKGNVLFLILIAVALFAALSYAATKSNQSGTNVTKERSSISLLL